MRPEHRQGMIVLARMMNAALEQMIAAVIERSDVSVACHVALFECVTRHGYKFRRRAVRNRCVASVPTRACLAGRERTLRCRRSTCRSTHRAAGSPAQGLASRSFDSRTSAHVWIRKHLGWRSVTRAIGYEDAAMRSVGRGGCRRYGRANVTRYVTKHSLTGIQRVGVHGFSEELAPQPGLEPGTLRLTEGNDVVSGCLRSCAGRCRIWRFRQ